MQCLYITGGIDVTSKKTHTYTSMCAQTPIDTDTELANPSLVNTDADTHQRREVAAVGGHHVGVRHRLEERRLHEDAARHPRRAVPTIKGVAREDLRLHRHSQPL